MDEAEGRTRKIETELNAYNNEITYWKKAAFARVLNDSKEEELAGLAPSRVLLIRKEKGKKTVNIDKITF